MPPEIEAKEGESGILSPSLLNFLKRWGPLMVLLALAGAALGYWLAARSAEANSGKYETEALLRPRFSVSATGTITDRDRAQALQTIGLAAIKIKNVDLLAKISLAVPEEYRKDAQTLAEGASVSGEPADAGRPYPRLKAGPATSFAGITDTPFLSIQVRDTDQQRATVYANAAAQVLMDELTAEHQALANGFIDHGDQQLAEIQLLLTDAWAAREQIADAIAKETTGDYAESVVILQELYTNFNKELTALRGLVSGSRTLTPADLEPIDVLLAAIAAENAKMRARETATVPLLDRLSKDPELALADLRADTLQASLESQMGDYIQKQIRLGELGEPMSLVYPAPLARAQEPTLSKRNGLMLGFMGGLVIAWLFANAYEAVRPRNQKGQQRPDGTSGWGAWPPAAYQVYAYPPPPQGWVPAPPQASSPPQLTAVEPSQDQVATAERPTTNDSGNGKHQGKKEMGLLNLEELRVKAGLSTEDRVAKEPSDMAAKG